MPYVRSSTEKISEERKIYVTNIFFPFLLLAHITAAVARDDGKIEIEKSSVSVFCLRFVESVSRTHAHRDAAAAMKFIHKHTQLNMKHNNNNNNNEKNEWKVRERIINFFGRKIYHTAFTRRRSEKRSSLKLS